MQVYFSGQTINTLSFKYDSNGSKASTDIYFSCLDSGKLWGIEIINSNLKQAFRYEGQCGKNEVTLIPYSRIMFDERFAVERYYSPHVEHFVLRTAEKKSLELIIKTTESYPDFKHVVVLPCDIELENYLSTLSYPFDMEEIVSVATNMVGLENFNEISFKSNGSNYRKFVNPFRGINPVPEFKITPEFVKQYLSVTEKKDSEQLMAEVFKSLESQQDEIL